MPTRPPRVGAGLVGAVGHREPSVPVVAGLSGPTDAFGTHDVPGGEGAYNTVQEDNAEWPR